MNYQGVRVTPQKEIQRVQVKDYMSRKLVTFHPDQQMDEAIECLLAKKVSGGPVVDDQNNLVGMLSEGDCLKELVKGKYNNSPNHAGKVRDHMTKDVKTISPDTNIFEVTKMFLTLKLRRFPVMEDGKLLGQISQRDVMRAVQKLKNETW